MIEGQPGYEKHLWPPTKKREKMNNLNNKSLCLDLEGCQEQGFNWT